MASDLAIVFGFTGLKISQPFLTAVEMGVFTALGDKKMTGEQLGKALGLHERGIWDLAFPETIGIENGRTAPLGGE